MLIFVILGTNSSFSMHLAGAFKVPSLTLLGNWYDSAKLHHQQWGYPEGTILGKEVSSYKSRIATTEDALSQICEYLRTKNR